MNNLVIIDPGHGGKDPGTYFEDTLEKTVNLETALTVKWLLAQAGYSTRMTRIDDGPEPSLRERVKHVPGTLCYISIHYNMPKSYGLVYYETNDDQSLGLAKHLSREAGLSRIWASERSRFGGLYIDRIDSPAVIYEVAAIDEYPIEEEEARNYRIQVAWTVVRAILLWNWERLKA